MSRLSALTSNVVLLACWGLLLASPVRADEYRTWTDSTGKYKIQAKFESVENGKVKLLRKDGKEVTLEVQKLSRADQAFVEREGAKALTQKIKEHAAERMNESKGGTGKKKTPASGESPGAELPKSGGAPLDTEDSSPPAETRKLDADMSDAAEIAFTAMGTPWLLSVSPPAEGTRPKSVMLPPQTNISERVAGMAVSHDGKAAAIAYCDKLVGPNAVPNTRVVLCDLQSGRVAMASADGEMAMLALHDDGRQILMRCNEFMPGQSDRLEIWRIKGKQVVRSLVWTPFKEESHFDRDVKWAEFLDGDKLAVCSKRGELAIWDLAAGRPLCRLPTDMEQIPAVSPDRKWIACVKRKLLGVLDVEKQKIVATAALPDDAIWPALAFSPSGKRLAFVVSKRVLVLDTATGKREKDFDQPLVDKDIPLLFPDEKYLLARGELLVDLESQLKLWRYGSVEAMRTVGGTTLMATRCDITGGAIIAAKVPHSEALAKLKTALAQPDFFIYRKGTPVKIDVSALPDADGQRRTREALTKKFAALGCPVKDDAQVEVVALIEGPESRMVNLIQYGNRQVQEYSSVLRFMHQGKMLWQTAGSNVPTVWSVKEGQTIEELIEAVNQRRSYEFYEQVGLPEFLQKPPADSNAEGSGSGESIGESQVTPKGLR